jgi:hypothetical protein
MNKTKGGGGKREGNALEKKKLPFKLDLARKKKRFLGVIHKCPL